ncbi:cupin domain-containing protein [Arthrobacter crystallopoietes]|uniref:cupin domain-containing protein n=1 Tax=Crystallibacter crystallopoietes TaxID=37928 RepID=UPI003001997D
MTAIGRRHLDTARRVTSGRSANTVYGGHEHVLRQTVIALAGGQELNEHLNPGEATVLVLSGRIRLFTQTDNWDGRDGDLLVVPPGLYSVRATEDSVVLLTVAKTDRLHQHREDESAVGEVPEPVAEGEAPVSGYELDEAAAPALSEKS